VAAADISDAAESSDAAPSAGVPKARAPMSAAVRAERGSQSAARPETEFTPPGRNEPVTKCDGWREGNSHAEYWGDTRLWVKRENDGWKVSGSDLYNEYCRNPDDPSDWAIFNIRVDGIAG